MCRRHFVLLGRIISCCTSLQSCSYSSANNIIKAQYLYFPVITAVFEYPRDQYNDFYRLRSVDSSNFGIGHDTSRLDQFKTWSVSEHSNDDVDAEMMFELFITAPLCVDTRMTFQPLITANTCLLTTIFPEDHKKYSHQRRDELSNVHTGGLSLYITMNPFGLIGSAEGDAFTHPAASHNDETHNDLLNLGPGSAVTSTMQKRAWWKPDIPRWSDDSHVRLTQRCQLQGGYWAEDNIWDWMDASCNAQGNVEIICAKVGRIRDTRATITIVCRGDEDCIETIGVRNRWNLLVTGAACVPKPWRYLMQKVTRRGRWIEGLICGVSNQVSPGSGLRSAMIDFTLYVHRPRLSDPELNEDLPAHSVFIWDISESKQKGHILIKSAFEVSRASVSVSLEQNMPKIIKACVVIHDYWQIRDRNSPIQVDFTHSEQYSKVPLAVS